MYSRLTPFVATFFLFFIMITIGCGFRTTPWDKNIPQKYQNLTQKHLDRMVTLDPGSKNFQFAVIGDPQGTPQDFLNTIESINSHDEISFILILGDITDYGLKHEYMWAAEAIETSQKPVLTVIGNHDSIALGKEIYQTMFGPLDYIFYFGTVKFVMWNNNQYEFSTDNFDWLKDQVNSNSIVASHIPPVVDIHTEEQINLWTTLQGETGVIASLHGHRGGTRSYLWFKNNTPYYIVARNRGIRWGKISVQGHELTIQDCHNQCNGEVRSL